MWFSQNNSAQVLFKFDNNIAEQGLNITYIMLLKYWLVWNLNNSANCMYSQTLLSQTQLPWNFYMYM